MNERTTTANLEHHLVESEARHRLLVESWAQAVWETDANGSVVADSPSWRAYTGQTLEEWLGYGWLDAIYPDDWAYAERQWREAIAARELVDAEFRLRAPGGGWRWTNLRAAPVFDARGQVEKWVGMNIDIDSRKRAETALRESEDRYRTLFGTMDEAFAVVEVLRDDTGRWCDFRFLEVNPAFMAHTSMPYPVGQTATELLGTPNPRWTQIYGRALDTGEKLRVQEIEPTLGRVFDLNIFTLDLARDQVAVLFTDITARVRAQDALRESEERLRLIVDNVPVQIGYYDRDLRYVYVNENGARFFGVSREAVPGVRLADSLKPHVFERLHPWLERALAGERVSFEDCEPDKFGPGSDGWTEETYIPRILEDGTVDGFYAIVLDNTDRKRRELELRASEAHLGAIFATASVGMSEVSLDGRFLRVNPALCRILGRPEPELLTLGIADVTEPASLSPSLEAVRRSLKTDQTTSLDKRYRRPDGVVVWANSAITRLRDAQGLPGNLLVVTVDLTERHRAEQALRESEERFRQFAASSADVIWIRHATTWMFEYVSPAVQAVYGVPPDAVLADAWLLSALIVPEERDRITNNVKRVSDGEIVVQEYRIQRPTDLAFRWIRSTGFPLHGANGRVERIGAIAQDITEAKLAAEHSAVLLAELQHRVRNIMALLRSITNRTGERAESVPEYRDLMMGRLLAFARVQALLTRAANVGVGIATIVRDEISVQAQHESQYILDGPEVALSPKAAEVLTLAIHELATNAVKYGALSVPDGKVTVRWSTFEKRAVPWLLFDWTEEGAPARSEPASDTLRRRGFGSDLIEGRIPYELRGRGQVTIEPGGAHCHLEFPLQGGASILETSAPQRATVFGGAIDMTGEPDLTGRRVLVVEDDFYLAIDTARALRGAGAEVMGPCATEEDARAELARQRPDAVVVDINLGSDPSFKLAETLKDQGISFVFTTGYDAEAIPVEFEGIERLEKPLQLRQIVGAVARLTTAS